MKKCKRVKAINDEGIQVPLTSSGSDKHGGPITSTAAVTAYLDDFEKALKQIPIDGEDYYGFQITNIEVRKESIIDSLWTRFNNWLNSPSPI